MFLVVPFFLLFYFLNIRICVFYNLFKIPCPGCGLSRAIIQALHLNIIESIKYNVLGIPVIFFMITLVIGFYYDYKKQITTFNDFLKKYKLIFITIAIILTTISWIINLNNDLLY